MCVWFQRSWGTACLIWPPEPACAPWRQSETAAAWRLTSRAPATACPTWLTPPPQVTLPYPLLPSPTPHPAHTSPFLFYRLTSSWLLHEHRDGLVHVSQGENSLDMGAHGGRQRMSYTVFFLLLFCRFFFKVFEIHIFFAFFYRKMYLFDSSQGCVWLLQNGKTNLRL